VSIYSLLVTIEFGLNIPGHPVTYLFVLKINCSENVFKVTITSFKATFLPAFNIMIHNAQVRLDSSVDIHDNKLVNMYFIFGNFGVLYVVCLLCLSVCLSLLGEEAEASPSIANTLWHV